MWARRSGIRIFAASAALVGVVGLATPATARTSEREPEPEPEFVLDGAEAAFEGGLIDLGEDWGDAEACLVWADNQPECFRSEAEMDSRIRELGGEPALSRTAAKAAPGPVAPAVAAASASCSSSLRLYKNSNYGGSVLSLYSRNGWTNLSPYGFNQAVSSFKVGACDAQFADYSNGGGAWYASWRTNAYDAASSMNGGWNDDVSSVRIY